MEGKDGVESWPYSRLSSLSLAGLGRMRVTFWTDLRNNNYLLLKWVSTLSYIISGIILVFGLNKAGIFGFLFSHFLLLCIFYKLRDLRLVVQYFAFCVFDSTLINYWFLQ